MKRAYRITGLVLAVSCVAFLLASVKAYAVSDTASAPACSTSEAFCYSPLFQQATNRLRKATVPQIAQPSWFTGPNLPINNDNGQVVSSNE